MVRCTRKQTTRHKRKRGCRNRKQACLPAACAANGDRETERGVASMPHRVGSQRLRCAAVRHRHHQRGATAVRTPLCWFFSLAPRWVPRGSQPAAPTLFCACEDWRSRFARRASRALPIPLATVHLCLHRREMAVKTATDLFALLPAHRGRPQRAARPRVRPTADVDSQHFAQGHFPHGRTQSGPSGAGAQRLRALRLEPPRKQVVRRQQLTSTASGGPQCLTRRTLQLQLHRHPLRWHSAVVARARGTR
jgi:hypothetical protein